MEQINIYEGDNVISHILVEDGIQSLEANIEQYEHVYAVMDNNVAMTSAVAAEVADMLNRRGVPGMLLDVSEKAKCMDTVMEICEWLLESGADRDALVLAIGGGITSDMVGFAASIYKRGVRFAYVPTTLLSQVDAAIGGKTGINFDGYKNMIGTIRQPEFTYICPQFLESLPMEDFQAGAAEMLKTFIIEDNGEYEAAMTLLQALTADFIASCEGAATLSYNEERWPEVISARISEMTPLIAAAAKVKAGIVSRDQFESGERRKLNLGHTFAHAIEKLSIEMNHGEAVAAGMVLAARLAVKLGTLASDEAERIERVLASLGFVLTSPVPVKRLVTAISKDKKADGDSSHFVLPTGIGSCEVRKMSISEIVNLTAEF